MDIAIERLNAGQVRERLHELGRLLVDVVENGSSVGFLRGLDPAKAEQFWSSLLPDVERGSSVFVGATIEGRLRGTAILKRASMENGRHRAEIMKVMVDPQYRRLGVGQALMRRIDREATDLDLSLLVLDTETNGDAIFLYRKLGFIKASDIPNYAASVDGDLVSTTYMFKKLP